MTNFTHIDISITFGTFAIQNRNVCSYANNVIDTRTRNLTRYGQFVTRRRLGPRPSSSGTTTYHSLRPNRITLNPDVYNRLCGLSALTRRIRSFRKTHARFLIVTPQSIIRSLGTHTRHGGTSSFRAVVAFVPLIANPNMLTSLLSILHSTKLGVADFVSHPVGKGSNACDFVTALSTSPQRPGFRTILRRVTRRNS